MSATFLETMRELRKNPETSKSGLKWLDQEDDELLDKVKEGISIEDIAKDLKRTPGSIKTRILLNAVKKIDAGADPKNIASELKITLPEIKEFREKKALRDEKINSYNNSNKNITNPTIKDCYNLLKDLSVQINDLKNRR